MIKLKFNTGTLKASQNSQNSQTPSTPTAGSPTPNISTGSNSAASAASPSIVPKIRFKNLKPSGSASKAAAHPPSTPASKITKPSGISSSKAKLVPLITTFSSPAGSSGGDGAIHTPITLKTPKLKLKASSTRPKKRHFEPGLGYDSEASDREEDPLIEEQFILRMKPGPDCDFLREVIDSRTLDNNTDVWFKFKENRKAVVCVRGNLYSALLVDLPCIIESSKTMDKKAIFKTADICQMLLVGDRIPNEDAICNVPYKPQDLIYPHGLTPPLQYVRKRRFRKRVSNRTIEAVEAEVDRLLQLDQEADSTRYELLDAEQLMREEGAGDEGYDMLGQAGGDGGDKEAGDGYNDEDAEGEEDYEMDEDDLALQMESALMGGAEDADADAEGEIDEDAIMAALGNGGRNANTSGAGGAAAAASGAEAESEEEEGDEDEDASDAEGEEAELDESAQETAAQSQKIREEIADLEAAYKSGLREMEKMQNPIMKQRKQAALERIVKELEFKQSTLGGGVGGAVI